jgi:hypothetical protein
MCPVRVSLSSPLARSQTLMVRSAEPVTNHSFPGSKARLRTQPRCPAQTRYIFHGACQTGRGHAPGSRLASCALGTYSCFSPVAVGTKAFALWCTTSAPASARARISALQFLSISGPWLS